MTLDHTAITTKHRYVVTSTINPLSPVSPSAVDSMPYGDYKTILRVQEL